MSKDIGRRRATRPGTRRLATTDVPTESEMIKTAHGYRLTDEAIERLRKSPLSEAEILKDFMAADRFGTPDWRDEQAYIAMDRFNDAQFRWEFLRRSPAYRDMWKRSEHDLARAARWFRIRFNISVPVNPRVSCELLESPTSALAQAVTLELSNGVTDGKVRFIDDGVEGRILTDQEVRNVLADGIVPSRVWIPVYLENKSERQFDGLAKPIAEMRRKFVRKKSKSRARRNMWPRYLRIIDATDQKASADDIHKAIWPRLEFADHRVRNSLEAAIEARDHWRF